MMKTPASKTKREVTPMTISNQKATITLENANTQSHSSTQKSAARSTTRKS